MKLIVRAIKRFRRRHPISFRFVREGKEHVHKNPVKKPVAVPSLEEMRTLFRLSTKGEGEA